MIKWEIVSHSDGSYTAQLVGRPEPGTPAGYKPGFMMGGILYESSRFDTRRQAEAYILRRSK